MRLKENKKCVICDKELLEQNKIYSVNHYLCSFECANLYHDYALWDSELKHFVIDLKLLTKLREHENGLPTDKSILERIDLDENKLCN
jgi:hypothetical protein